MRLITLLTLMVTIMFAGAAHAQRPGFYLGGAFGITAFEDDHRSRDMDINLDDDDRAGQLFFGVNVNPYFGVEATFANLGEYTDTTRTFTDKFSVIAVTAVGKIPLGRATSPVSLYGKAGLGVVNWEEEDTFLNTSGDDSGGALALGFGVIFSPMRDQYLAFRLGWDFYAFTLEEDYPSNREYDQNLGMASLGLQINF